MRTHVRTAEAVFGTVDTRGTPDSVIVACELIMRPVEIEYSRGRIYARENMAKAWMSPKCLEGLFIQHVMTSGVTL